MKRRNESHQRALCLTSNYQSCDQTSSTVSERRRKMQMFPGQTALFVPVCSDYLTNVFVLLLPLLFSTAAHGILWHGHLPGFLRGRIPGLPHSAHQDQAQAEEKPGSSRQRSLSTVQTDGSNDYRLHLLSLFTSHKPFKQSVSECTAHAPVFQVNVTSLWSGSRWVSTAAPLVDWCISSVDNNTLAAACVMNQDRRLINADAREGAGARHRNVITGQKTCSDTH